MTDSLVVVGIDPGSEKSAVVIASVVPDDPGPPWGIWPTAGWQLSNGEVLGLLHRLVGGPVLAIEAMTYGQNVGHDIFKTATWGGRFIQRALDRGFSELVIEVGSPQAKAATIGKARGTDAEVRQALISAYGGKAEAFGVKCKPCKGKGWTGAAHAECLGCAGSGWEVAKGPLHGWTGYHLFRALAVLWAAFEPDGKYWKAFKRQGDNKT